MRVNAPPFPGPSSQATSFSEHAANTRISDMLLGQADIQLPEQQQSMIRIKLFVLRPCFIYSQQSQFGSMNSIPLLVYNTIAPDLLPWPEQYKIGLSALEKNSCNIVMTAFLLGVLINPYPNQIVPRYLPYLTRVLQIDDSSCLTPPSAFRAVLLLGFQSFFFSKMSLE